jgi:hypothetical protein
MKKRKSALNYHVRVMDPDGRQLSNCTLPRARKLEQSGRAIAISGPPHPLIKLRRVHCSAELVTAESAKENL